MCYHTCWAHFLTISGMESKQSDIMKHASWMVDRESWTVGKLGSQLRSAHCCMMMGDSRRSTIHGFTRIHDPLSTIHDPRFTNHEPRTIGLNGSMGNASLLVASSTPHHWFAWVRCWEQIGQMGPIISKWRID